MRSIHLLLAAAALVLLAGNACADPKDPPVKHTAKENRLGKERSPYLRQHKLNPVDWYPWGKEAFERARKEDKPIFLSVGYAACHWCHVMEHESFEDEPTARLLNDAFVCVKVDREERPDLDRVYMTAVQVASQGRGGWPMTVIMTPDEKPFFARTYLSKEQLQQVTKQISRLWREDRKQLQGYADSLAEAVARSVGAGDLPDTDDSDAEIFKVLADRLANTFDRRHGGFGDRPKFPPHAELLYHLHADGGRMDADERAMVFTTLDAMARGGIHDQVGGGFHRYSTDAQWLLPHFEKMLYDNALLAQAFSRAYAITKKPRYRRVVERLLGWLEREMARPSGGYASSLDADTEGEEGITYTWTRPQLRAALPAADADLIEAVFDVQERGNFREEATGHHTGHNNLHWTASLADLAKARDTQPDALRARIDGLLDKLLGVRNGRAQPGLDDKVITGWNGLLLSAFARAGTDLGDPTLHERGRKLADYLLSASRRADGTLLRFPKDSGPEIPAFCEDYVHMINGLLDLAEATGESRWSDAARALAQRLNDEFEDIEGGGFFATSMLQHERLIARAKETFDSPIPSDNGVAARVNLRLHALTGDAAQRKAADRTLALFRSQMASPRMSTGVVALTDALRLRGELDAASGQAPVRGDVHARRGVVQADVFLSRSQAALGSRVEILVRVHVEAGWHVNAHRPAREGLVGTSLETAERAPAGLEDLRYPKAVSRRLGPDTEAPVDLYEGTFDIRATLTVPKDVPPGPRKIPLVLRVQPCDDRSCLDALTLELPLSLRFAETDGSVTHATLFPDAK